MATTTNFGWPTPDNTSYVRNGASDMRTLGSAIDTSMADLKGGTAGQVLKKNTNTDMDFVWAAESGGISPTIFDAKGDLIGASAADTAARLAVGSDDQVLVADSSASTGLAWKSYGAQLVAGKNKILNGDFGIWQRGTSFSSTSPYPGLYTADRWTAGLDGISSTVNISRQTFTPGTAPVAGYEAQNYLRFSNAGTSGAYEWMSQRIEDVRTFAGQTVTLSFWAKAVSSFTSQVTWLQEFGSGGSAQVYNRIPTTIGTSWARYQLTFTLPSLSGKTIGTNSVLAIFPIVAYQQAVTVDIWGVQLEAGSVATPFTTATGNPATELAACQRYYWRISAPQYYVISIHGSALSTTQATMTLPSKVTMRSAPTALDYSGVSMQDGASSFSVSSLTLNTASADHLRVLAAATGLTQFRPYYLYVSDAAGGYIGVSAEL